jgi:hypothetical protein
MFLTFDGSITCTPIVKVNLNHTGHVAPRADPVELDVVALAGYFNKLKKKKKGAGSIFSGFSVHAKSISWYTYISVNV